MRVVAAAAAAVAVALSLPAAGQPSSDWERENEERLKQSEEVVVAPPPLDRGSLVELEPEAPTDFRYFVDAASVSVGRDRVVRYTLVARSPGGAETVTFEGLRCSGEYRVNAVGRPGDAEWSGRPGAWRPVPRDARRAQYLLWRRYFCAARNTPIETAGEGVAALRAGGHPARQKVRSEQY